ncbi:hypothetical protein [Schauerella aestuarii]|uniref:hypothetical protein n=1 Tax=Schauerella aestuarii TaxID=2511204 RepID=UPI001370EE84|nr:hypothetical protein [Achromobacter aestuarii]MYZ45160.1 hypothetical protein [Achromobacter aestuarii]
MTYLEQRVPHCFEKVNKSLEGESRNYDIPESASRSTQRGRHFRQGNLAILSNANAATSGKCCRPFIYRNRWRLPKGSHPSALRSDRAHLD